MTCLQLQESYEHCHHVARHSASSFFYSFFLLPKEKRRAMYALYAYLRGTDDLADSDQPLAARMAALADWQLRLNALFDGLPASDGIWPALADIVGRYEIPREYLESVICGVRSDLEQTGFGTFEELVQYCHQVSTSVGLACLRIWGGEDETMRQAAESCGLAVQLTNILRDLREDAERGRIYLPAAELAEFNCSPDDFRALRPRPEFNQLMAHQIQRIERYYVAGRALEQDLRGDGRPIVRSILRTYRCLLQRIKRNPGQVLAKRIGVPRWQRLWIVGSEQLRAG